MPKTTVLRIKTPHGEFTRATATAYTHAVVRTSERANAFHQQVLSGDANAIRRAKSGVATRWRKDRGFAVTWHKSAENAAAAAASGYVWDEKVGAAAVYPVEGAAK